MTETTMPDTFNIQPDPTQSPIGSWFWIDLNAADLTTGVDYHLLSHGTPLIPLARIAAPEFPDVYRTDLAGDLGASVDDVKAPLGAGLHHLAEYQFPAGVDEVTVYGTCVGAAPAFADRDVAAATRSVPEPGVMLAALLAVGWRRKRRMA